MPTAAGLVPNSELEAQLTTGGAKSLRPNATWIAFTRDAGQSSGHPVCSNGSQLFFFNPAFSWSLFRIFNLFFITSRQYLHDIPFLPSLALIFPALCTYRRAFDRVSTTLHRILYSEFTRHSETRRSLPSWRAQKQSQARLAPP